MDVGCAGRRVKDKEIKVAPVGVGDKLLQCRCGHASAPQRGGVGIDEETNGQELYAILLDGLDELATILLYRIGALALYAEHLGHGGTEDVGIEQTHLVAHDGEGYGEIGRDGRLAYAAFARAYGYHVLHLRQQFAHLGAWCRLELGLNLDLYRLVHVVVYGCLGSLQGRFEERVGLAGEYQCETHLHTVDANIVGEHLCLYQVFLVARVSHRCQSVGDKFWI